ncbi:xanthine dehydrogenase accessory factor [Parvibaculum indicum]|uniref:XdhC family protein n=1 Tax=Parvibaculum indicum TaxID=562969 RepID=UPI0014201141|nr:XdhC family protein [Parvibaculum indicum]NIJ39905.1 xanthine dehydrogenase accessory factor [Parvibaculum indicum]
MKAEILEELVRARAEKRPAVLATRLSDGVEKLVYQTDTQTENWLVEAVSEVLRADKGRVQADPDGEDWFLNPFNPPLRLVILGAVHIAQPLAKIAELANYDVTVIDPRTAFASEERFPGVTLVTDWPDEAMETIDLDTRTAVVTLTHDPKLDDPGLHAALKSPCFYIGALGSRKTHGSRVERLTEAGFSDNEIARIHGPVGLNIGARSPAEIAISIMAEMTERLRT